MEHLHSSDMKIFKEILIMKHYDIFIKGNFTNSKPEPVRVFSHTALNDNILTLLRQMPFDTAAFYCRNVLKASIMRGHPGVTDE